MPYNFETEQWENSPELKSLYKANDLAEGQDRGRVRRKIPEPIRVLNLAMKGHNLKEIAALCGMSHDAFEDLRTRCPDYDEALFVGPALAKGLAAEVILGHISKGSLDASKYWLSKRGGAEFSDKVSVSVGNKDGKPLLTASVPLSDLPDEELESLLRLRAAADEVLAKKKASEEAVIASAKKA